MKIWELLHEDHTDPAFADLLRETLQRSSLQAYCAPCKALFTQQRRQNAKPTPKPKKVRWPRPKKPAKRRPVQRSLSGFKKPPAPTKPRKPRKPSGSVAPPKPIKWN